MYGMMSQQGRDLNQREINGLVHYLTDKAAPSEPALPDATCQQPGAPLNDPTLPQWNGWGVDLRQRRFQTAAMAKLSATEVPRLKVRWAFGFPGDTRAYAQPAIWGGRVFVGSAGGRVYSLDAATGCQRWAFDVGIGVRTAMTVAPLADRFAVYFGDQRGDAYALDAETGRLLWQTRVEDHTSAVITGAPSLANGVLYVPVSSREEIMATDPRYPCCSFRGLLAAIDARTGRIIWRSYVGPPASATGTSRTSTPSLAPSGGAIWSSPTIDVAANRIYVTTGDSYSAPALPTSDAFVAFDLPTGKLLWSRQMTEGDTYNLACNGDTPGRNCPPQKGGDFDFGSSPILVDLPDGRRALIAGQKSGTVHAIDPDRDGAILWQRTIGRGSTLGGIQWGSAADATNVYVALSDVGIKAVPPGTAGAQSSRFGVTLKLDPSQGGGLYAFNQATGEIVWHTPHPGCKDATGCSPAQSAAVTAIPDVVFSGGLDGHLRAYAAASGQIIWDVDTAQPYDAVNGVPAHGGALDGPGPVVAGGMLYVTSGYANFGSAPGNVLLAFSVDGK